jgi:hypothetical protein
MPLDEFVVITMKGLISGDSHICAGIAEEVWNRFEKGKEEYMLRILHLITQG